MKNLIKKIAIFIGELLLCVLVGIIVMIVGVFIFLALGKWVALVLAFLVGFTSLNILKKTKLNILPVITGLLIISFVTITHFDGMTLGITILTLYIGIVLLITPMTLAEEKNEKTDQK